MLRNCELCGADVMTYDETFYTLEFCEFPPIYEEKHISSFKVHICSKCGAEFIEWYNKDRGTD